MFRQLNKLFPKKNNSESSRSFLEALPAEILLNIFNYLSVRDIATMEAVCQTLHAIAADPRLPHLTNTEKQEYLKEHGTGPSRRIPDEILLHTFSFLTVNDRALAGGTCHRWNRLAGDQNFSAEFDECRSLHDFARGATQEAENTQTQYNLSQKLANFIGGTPERETIIIVGISPLKMKILRLTDDKNENRDPSKTPLSRTHAIDIRLFQAGGRSIALLDAPYLDRQRAITREYCKVRQPNIIIFCPDESQDMSEQLMTLSTRLTQWNAADTIIFVVNGNINAGKYISIPLEKDDSIQSFVGRMISLAAAANNRLLDEDCSSSQDNEDKPDPKRCLIS